MSYAPLQRAEERAALWFKEYTKVCAERDAALREASAYRRRFLSAMRILRKVRHSG